MITPQTIYIFRSGTDTFGYTLDPTGSNLPMEHAPAGWEKMNTIKVAPGDPPRTGPAIDTVQAGIAQDGWFIATEVVRLTATDLPA